MYRSLASAYLIISAGYKTPCWIWQRAKITRGYGQLRYNGSHILAHRYFYEKYRGLIPDDFELDHLCRNHDCVNPEHLEIVTHQVNVKRGYASRKQG